MSAALRSIYGKPGTYDNGNVIDVGGVNSEFVNFNPATLTFNVMLKAGAQAIGPGTTAGRRPRHPRRYAHGSLCRGGLFIPVLSGNSPLRASCIWVESMPLKYPPPLVGAGRGGGSRGP